MEHPSVCYVFIPSDNSVGIVKWGEKGYYNTDYPHNYTKEIVDEMNTKFDFTKDEIRAMVICSMVNIPETEDAWIAHYNKCLETFASRKGVV